MTTTTLRRDTHEEYAHIAERTRQARQLLAFWHSRARQRRHLSELVPAQLDDVGITAEAARAEAAKPFWR